MYLDHFKLAAKPFQITSDPKFLWLGEKHKEALATLRYGILDNRGFLLLTGEVGTGKTLLINRLITMLDQDTIAATLHDPDLQDMDFYNLLADGFKMNRTFDSKGAFLIHLRDFLYQCHANNKQVLLIVDECQRLTPDLMENIRILSNIELHDRKLINIFLVGQQEFNAVLAAPQSRALTQRITVRYHIAPLERGEIEKYIFHRLRVAGGTHKIFSPAAIEQIFYFSGGIPRLINILCDHALLTAYARGERQVDSNIILECAEELRIPLLPNETNQAPMRVSDSKSIADAAATTKRNENRPPATASKDTPTVELPLYQRNLHQRSTLKTLLYTLGTAVLVVLSGFIVMNFSSAEKMFWDRVNKQPLQSTEAAQEDKKRISTLLETVGQQADMPAVSAEPVRIGSGENIQSKPEKAIVEPALGALPPESGIEPLALRDEKIIIRFGLNSSEIENQSFEMLDRIAAYLVRHPGEKVMVRGHTDSSGTASYNESISRFRASVVKSYLVGKGVSNEQIKTHAVGDVEPIAPNTTSHGRHQNRRVEIELDARQGLR
jgi:general secretion pathway protein A